MLNAMTFYIEPIYKVLEILKFLVMVNFVEPEVNPEEYKPFMLHLSRRIDDEMIEIIGIYLFNYLFETIHNFYII